MLSEFVCQQDHLFSTIASILPIVTLSGNFLAGHISDHFGRKWLMIAGITIEMCCGIAESLAPRLAAGNLGLD
ncbi:unnamed protein product [Anisakis simplex]|uniref:MFS domain-containing protein n=1 Tax=Anisakis simplex TaxID=6269 RepID=A0A0M3KJR8_ANISI|nr:unnamed protein product [Anisakis simplex]